MRAMPRFWLLATVALILSGCVMRGQQEPAPVDQATPAPQQPVPTPQPVPTVPSVPSVPSQPGPIEHQEPTPAEPKVRQYDWSGAVQPMVGKMLQAGGVNAGSVLLVDSVNNRTNGSLQTGPATEALRNALANNNTFTLVSAQQLSMAKQQLGLSPQDSLGTRSKAIGIARNVGAHYVLYTSASGNVGAPTLQMQLMLVQTGEIIWSGKGAVSQIQ
ncbi:MULTISPECIES: penicillin-binding protein activator LpoB [Atlantibacter]|jgi:penicillin-binding protein activator|uniref:Penicillin-binding protein activator LpoB n=1 Tax=Atlantibacter subterraneus TaxID=255519 RepID=A0A427V8H6_9ENTR|nr:MULTISPECIES: penicillin-binding protein activator LpoB [Atlantibacter]QFH71898.1 penicillin-binding protein activator LpoB [Enterobacter sp. E76]MBL7635902.1 penicillin-binding protein activator LpoB [Atlantibacter hermannii]MBL7676789.1 penicillin-binding protein activator LpoB [Atlantibacter hermannii]MCZ7836464.1 penicillin-binding protein activator LpoB [Atlantibacter hermannii]MDA3131549.1 penicillin-binding protein activator LpoB [Atlantibacter subterranea]